MFGRPAGISRLGKLSTGGQLVLLSSPGRRIQAALRSSRFVVDSAGRSDGPAGFSSAGLS
jgi:hypothetical protein